MNALQSWHSALDVSRSVERLFDHIPDIMYFAKDRERRFMTANREFVEHCGLSSARELYGKTDKELFPPYMASKFESDDKAVFQSKEPLLNLVELFLTREGLPEWFITQKLPLFNRQGEIHGICGLIRSYERLLDHSNDPIFKLVAYIREHYARPIGIPEMAKSVGLSQRQLERRFQEVFRLSPRKYIIRVRVLIASEKLRASKASITDIAQESGFYDHSNFIRHFKSVLGVTPLVYRKRRF